MGRREHDYGDADDRCTYEANGTWSSFVSSRRRTVTFPPHESVSLGASPKIVKAPRNLVLMDSFLMS